jgi:transcription elongation factor Elf1
MAVIRLTTCNNIIEANMLKDMLENEGINCFLTNENFTTLLPAYNGMFGAGIQIMIDEANKDKAQKIIDEIQTRPDNEIKCPTCGSSNVGFGLGEKKFKKILIVIISLLNFMPFNNLKNTYYCKACKTEFKFY